MKLKKLDVTGFKSFVDRTTVAFPEGISAVVGPNGCGKSNIVDAIRWVMGEQSVKLLRGKSMEDIIFAGTEKRAPLNMAEVELTLVNDNGNTPEQYRQFSEIMVSRRLFRSGESAYFINKQPCRLKDIQDLFMGSGVGSRAYSVIEQARISTLIDAGPDERRLFVEEAAGIMRYKRRKNEALRKIERTQQNLFRINDVIVEVKRQLDSLKRQARKAERYKVYQERIEQLEVRLATYHYKTISDEIRDTQELLRTLRDDDFGRESQIAKLGATIEQLKEKRAVKGREISEHKAASYQMQRTIDKLERDMEHGRKDLERLIAEAEQIEAEVKEIEHRDREVGRECVNLNERSISLQEDIHRIEEAVKKEEPAAQGAKERLVDLDRIIETRKAGLMDLVTRKAAYQNTVRNAAQNKTSLAKRMERLRKEQAAAGAEVENLGKALTKGNMRLNDLRRELAEIGGSAESMEKQLAAKRKDLAESVRKVQTIESEKQKIRSRHTALKKMNDNYEWYKEGVRAIMRECDSGNVEQTGIHGLVADVIEAEPFYEDAVEAALGEMLQYVIVKDQDRGVAAIDYLRAQSAGRGGFIPVHGVRPASSTPADKAWHGKADATLLIDHMKIKEGYEHLIRSLVGHVMVADDLKDALQLWNKNGFYMTVVTPKGDRISPRGFLVGGSQDNATSGILAKKREIRELEAQVSEMEASGEEAKAAQRQLEAENIALETDIQKARQALRNRSQDETALEKEIYRLGEEIKHANHRLKIMDLEARQIEGEETDLERELEGYEKILVELSDEIRATESVIADNGRAAKEIAGDLESLNYKLIGFRVELTKLQAQDDNVKNTLQRLRSFQDERLRKLNDLTMLFQRRKEDRAAVEQRLAEDRKKIGRMHAELNTAEEVAALMEAEYQAIEGALAENEGALSDARGAQQQSLDKIQHLEIKQAEQRMRREHLVSRIKEVYGRDIEDSDGDKGGEIPVEEIESKLARLRDRINRIGEVNLAAISEYEALEERYRFLTEQRDDLVEAIEALNRVIRKINRTSLRQFIRTFKAVNEKLQLVFPRLFEGGAARLELTDPRRPLESGVSYLVHPPGKKLTRMSLLSGGEKALAAIALVFSLYMIKPSAFCIFDEIDAPLDDANADRLNHLLGEIKKDSQVVVITHNKQTMQAADALFGVTMEDKGISKLISVNLDPSAKSHIE